MVSTMKIETVRLLETRLRALLESTDAPQVDIEWLQLRCKDTLGFTDEWQQASLRQLQKDVSDFAERFPGLLPSSLLGEVDLEVVGAVAREIFAKLSHRDVPGDEIAAAIHDVLFGERELWRAARAGLVTRREAASALLAHLHTRSMERLGLSSDTNDARAWDDDILVLETALFGAPESR